MDHSERSARAEVTLNLLPPPLVNVTVPDVFSPSAIGSAQGCALKLIVMSSRTSEHMERLSVGPDAAIGILLHRVLERAGRETESSEEDIFEDELAKAVTALRRDPRKAHFADLSSTKPLAEWIRKRAWVLARARSVRPTSNVGNVGLTKGGMPSVTGAEVTLESQSLRLRGSADRVRLVGHRQIEVRDFKSGVTLTEDGTIKEDIVLQLQAYGLLVLEQRPGFEVRLVVDDGTEREIPFDNNSRSEARARLERITGSMPRAGQVSAASVARAGQSCWGCPVRHVCSSYREIAPHWWKRQPSDIDRLPSDTWGTVIESSESGTVVLRDFADRRVRISCIDARHGVISPGERAFFFGLESSGLTRGFDGARYHPRSFHELPRDRLDRRAWSLNIFLETGDVANVPGVLKSPEH